MFLSSALHPSSHAFIADLFLQGSEYFINAFPFIPTMSFERQNRNYLPVLKNSGQKKWNALQKHIAVWGRTPCSQVHALLEGLQLPWSSLQHWEEKPISEESHSVQNPKVCISAKYYFLCDRNVVLVSASLQPWPRVTHSWHQPVHYLLLNRQSPISGLTFPVKRMCFPMFMPNCRKCRHCS